jgi:hypothetical protein
LGSIEEIMRDVIWTIIGIWVFYKLYNTFFNRSSSTVYQKHDHHHYQSGPEVNSQAGPQASSRKKKIDDSEYTDFEEIK